MYHIGPNYCTHSYKRTVKEFPSLQITACVLFVFYLFKAYVVGIHLNCINLSMHFQLVTTTYAFIKKQEAHGPRFAHLSDIATADMQMFPIIYAKIQP